MFISRKVLYHIIGYALTFSIFIFPYNVLLNLLFKTELFNFSLFILNFFFYFFITYRFKFISSFKIFRLIILQLIGIGFISFWVSSLALIIVILSKADSFLFGIISSIIIILLCVISFLKGKSIKIRQLKLNSKKIKNNVKFLFISDVHLGSNSKNYLLKIVKKIRSLNFDFLIIGGDLIDSSDFEMENLKILKTIKKNIYFVTGNHEYYLKDWKNRSKILCKYHIKLLKNKAIKFKNLNIIGLDENNSIRNQKVLIDSVHMKNLFNLVVAHKPSIWSDSKKKNRFDVIWTYS